MPSSAATLVGSAGVGLLLLAFVLNLLRVVRTDGIPYAGLNLVGAGLACWSSFLIDFVPFVVLEAVWALAAGVTLVRALGRMV